MLDKSPRPTPVAVPNDLAVHWMPFTANRAFKKNPRLLAGAKDMHYFTVDGRKIIDAASGMWCTNAGHGRTQISAAIAKQAETAKAFRTNSTWQEISVQLQRDFVDPIIVSNKPVAEVTTAAEAAYQDLLDKGAQA